MLPGDRQVEGCEYLCRPLVDRVADCLWLDENMFK